LPIGCSCQVISNGESDGNSEDITSDEGDAADTSEGDMRCRTLVKGEALISILNWGL